MLSSAEDEGHLLALLWGVNGAYLRRFSTQARKKVFAERRDKTPGVLRRRNARGTRRVGSGTESAARKTNFLKYILGSGAAASSCANRARRPQKSLVSLRGRPSFDPASKISGDSTVPERTNVCRAEGASHRLSRICGWHHGPPRDLCV